ncbi:hypothetical protein [Pararhodobacter marinus]|uniref:hypothetical protein n=1 Tax=Pararhodobacter marinus TaxID=2184063 RepID=UPI003515CBF3
MADARPPVFCAVVSWRGMRDAAAAIASALEGVLDGLLVVYSNPDGTEETGAGRWIRADEADFFGRKFQRLAAEVPQGAAMLLIQADAGCDDWPGLARRWADLLQRHPTIGIWTPEIDNTAYPFALTARGQGPEDGLLDVTQTDGIVLGIAPAVLDRLRGLDYAENNLGWGIDWAAISYCGTAGLSVVGDPLVQVSHPPSRGYEGDAAGRQMTAFLTQLTPSEANIRDRVQRDLTLTAQEQGGRVHMLVSAYRPDAPAAGGVDPARLARSVAGLHLVAGGLLLASAEDRDTPLGIEADGLSLPLSPVPAGALPDVVPLAPSVPAGAVCRDVSGQRWSCPGQATWSLTFPPATGPARVPLCDPVEIPPGAGDLTLLMGMAVHRGYGDLQVSWQDIDDPGTATRHFIKMDPAFSGTAAKGDYQAVQLRIPASNGARILSLTLCVWPVSPAPKVPLVFFFTAPLLLPTARAESPEMPLVVTQAVPPSPALWRQTRIPPGASAVNLVAGGIRLPLLRAGASGARLHPLDEPGRFEATADHPTPALLTLDGRPTRRLWLSPAPTRLHLPRFPSGTGVALCDVTGSVVLRGG